MVLSHHVNTCRPASIGWRRRPLPAAPTRTCVRQLTSEPEEGLRTGVSRWPPAVGAPPMGSTGSGSSFPVPLPVMHRFLVAPNRHAPTPSWQES